MAKRDKTGTELPAIEGYTIEEQIGSGGFSQVYRARQHSLDRSVAIKVLNTSFADERQQRTFERECKVMGQLSTHQHIVTVFDSALTEMNHPCIIMELYGGTYRDLGVLPVPEVISVGAKIADALQAVHDQGIVHRDIKPHNIFLSVRGEPAIGDFGISSLEDERTITGGAGFSINYAAPEVFEEGGAGAPGDIYALGATLYHLATGEVIFPHSGDSPDRLRSTIHRIIAEAPPRLQVAGAPEALDRLLRSCMAKAVEDRPPNAHSVAEALRELERAVGPAPRREPTVAGPPPSVTRPAPPADESSGTENVTFLRDREQPPAATPSPEPADDAATKPPAIRVAAIAAALVVVLAIAFFAITAGGDDGTAETEPTPSPEVNQRELLLPPTDLVVSSNGAGEFELDWAEPDLSAEVRYEIHEPSSNTSQTVDGPPAIVQLDRAPTRACFEVRTLLATGLGSSQTVSAACSDD